MLCNSNPAAIMTDTSIADKVYMEPLTLEYVAKIVVMGDGWCTWNWLGRRIESFDAKARKSFERVTPR